MTTDLLALWRQIYRAAAMLEIPVSDKTLSVMIPTNTKTSEPKSVIVTDADFRTFMDALLHYHEYDDVGRYTSQVLWYALMIAYYIGMRPAEVYALKREDIHLEDGYITVNKSVGSDTSKRKVIVPTKTKNSIRKIPINSELSAILSKLLQWTDHEFLISDCNGSLMDTNYTSNYIHLVSKKCGIPFNFYMLRHKFATDLQKTEAPRTIQDLMGHASFSMSVEYARSSEDDRKEAVKKRVLS